MPFVEVYLVQPPKDTKDAYYRLAWGVHVKAYSSVMAVVTMMLAVVVMFVAFFGEIGYLWPYAIMNLLSGLLQLIGLCSSTWWLILPGIILTVISIIMDVYYSAKSIMHLVMTFAGSSSGDIALELLCLVIYLVLTALLVYSVIVLIASAQHAYRKKKTVLPT